jgi:hypothetical protein
MSGEHYEEHLQREITRLCAELAAIKADNQMLLKCEQEAHAELAAMKGFRDECERQFQEKVSELSAERERANGLSSSHERLVKKLIEQGIERDKLREALEPFANLRVSRFMTDGLKYEFRIDAGDLRRANAVLRETKESGDE